MPLILTNSISLVHRPEGVCRRHHRRPGELPGRGGRRAPGRPARIVFVVLRQCLQGSDRVHADHPGAAVALADIAPYGRGGMTCASA